MKRGKQEAPVYNSLESVLHFISLDQNLGLEGARSSTVLRENNVESPRPLWYDTSLYLMMRSSSFGVESTLESRVWTDQQIIMFMRTGPARIPLIRPVLEKLRDCSDWWRPRSPQQLRAVTKNRTRVH